MLVSKLLDQLMKSEKYGERRGAAFGLAGVVKGFGISCLKKYNIVTVLREGLADRFVLCLWFKADICQTSSIIITSEMSGETSVKSMSSNLEAIMILPSKLIEETFVLSYCWWRCVFV